MPSNKAVVDIVEQWSGQRPEKMLQSLEDWWNQTAPGSSHSALSFDPDGIEDLIKRLQDAFPSSPVLEAGDFRASGNVKTVQDLVDALQPAMVGAAMDAPVAGDVGAGRKIMIPKRAVKKRAAFRGKTTSGTKGRAGKKSPRKQGARKATEENPKAAAKRRPSVAHNATSKKKKRKRAK
jgi:hypothetical protein